MRVWSRVEWRQQSRLVDERNRLRRLHEALRVAATSRRDYEPHDVADDEAAVQADAIERRLTSIDQALERIDSGGYGTCLVCGSGIADERLETLPATAFCRSCAG
jgi:RNA polymerase-binding transcription factor DksA